MKLKKFSFNFLIGEKERKEFLNFLSENIGLRESTLASFYALGVGGPSAYKDYNFKGYYRIGKFFPYFLDTLYISYKYQFFLDLLLEKELKFSGKSLSFLKLLMKNPLRSSGEISSILNLTRGGVRSYFSSFILRRIRNCEINSILIKRFFFSFSFIVFGSFNKKRFEIVKKPR